VHRMFRTLFYSPNRSAVLKAAMKQMRGKRRGGEAG